MTPAGPKMSKVAASSVSRIPGRLGLVFQKERAGEGDLREECLRRHDDAAGLSADRRIRPVVEP
jgi:hypothetical protein